MAQAFDLAVFAILVLVKTSNGVYTVIMKNIKISTPTANDLKAMAEIWNAAFDSKDAELFFEHFYSQKLSLVSEYDNKAAAMGHLLPVGDLVTDKGDTIPTAMIYAVATLPEYRKLGLGSAISNALVEVARNNGYPAVVLCPAQDSLFDFYGMRTGMKEWFFLTEFKLKAPFSTQSQIGLSMISPEKYKELRDKLLQNIPHIRFNLHSLKYQKGLCALYGGGLFQIDSPIGSSCAIIERQTENSIWVKELIMPNTTISTCDYFAYMQNIAAAAISKFPADECIVRVPAINDHIDFPNPDIHHTTKRFAMLSLPPELHKPDDSATKQAWYGLAFD